MGARLATTCFGSANDWARFDLSMSLLEEHNANAHGTTHGTTNGSTTSSAIKRPGDPLQMYKWESSNRLALQPETTAAATTSDQQPAKATRWSRSTSGTTSSSSEESSSMDADNDDELSPCHREPTPGMQIPRTASVESFNTSNFEKYYELEEVIGVGTTSKCYKCRRREDNARFACKVIDKRRLGYDQHQKTRILHQLRREITVLSRLNHRNVARLIDAFETENFIVLVMEWLRGGELFDAIVERGHLTEPEAKRVAQSILSALSYLHEQGIVHRDIKAENLLLSCPNHQSMEVKLIDFGFAKVMSQGETTHSFLGTGGYLAPEILQHRAYTDTVDLWSFGVILYLILCGRLPFRTATCLRPTQKIGSVYRLTFPEKYWKNISVEARDLVQKLLVLDPADRLSAAEALQHPWFSQETE